MAKRRSAKSKTTKIDLNSISYKCYECGFCSICKWLLPIVILAIALVPGWYGTNWAKWVIVVSAAILLLKKWCLCQRR